MNEDQFKDALASEIQALLSVDPAPDFFARARSHAVNARAPWPNRRRGALIGMAAVTVIAAVVSWDQLEEQSRPETVNVSSAPQTTAALIPEPQPLILPVPSATASRTRQSAPEVLIDPAAGEALRRFLRDVEDGRVDASKIAALQVQAMELEPAADITVTPIAAFEPIIIEPLMPDIREERGNP